MRSTVSVLVLSACWSSTTEQRPVATSAPREAVAAVEPVLDAKRFAIVEVTPRFIECEGAKHFVLETRDRKPMRLVRANRKVIVGEHYVADLLFEDGVDCFADFEASALALVPAHDLRDARRLLARIQKTGIAKTIALATPPHPRETIGIARVIAVRGNQVRLEPIHGDVPAWIDLPFYTTELPRVGDPLVVASAHAKPTRLFVASSVREARRWLTAIDTDGWPPDVID